MGPIHRSRSNGHFAAKVRDLFILFLFELTRIINIIAEPVGRDDRGHTIDLKWKLSRN